MASAETQSPLPDAPHVGLMHMAQRLMNPTEERVNMLGGLAALHDRYGSVVEQRIWPFRIVNLYGPDANRLVLLDQDRIFSARRPWMAIMGRIFPNGLLLMDDDQHKHHRKIMHQPFKRPALRGYLDRMNEVIGERVGDWHNEGQPLAAFEAYKSLTLDMAAKIFVGVDLGPGAKAMNTAFEDLVAASMSRLRLPIPGLEFHRGLQARAFMIQFFGDLIGKKRETAGDDLFSRLCHASTEDGSRFSDQEIIDHMSFLMMAAHDTTTSSLCSLTYLLAKHPQWQDRVREESMGLASNDLDFDEADSLPALQQAIQETLRLYPPLPVIPRIANADFEFDGYRVHENSMVIVSPIHTHRMPEWWSDPERFDPDRFSPERAEHERHSHSWVPFGGGPHMCIGLRFAQLQIKTVIHQLVRRYRFEVPDNYTMPVQQAPISKPLDGLPVAFIPLER
jgi:cytochrome P450